MVGPAYNRRPMLRQDGRIDQGVDEAGGGGEAPGPRMAGPFDPGFKDEKPRAAGKGAVSDRRGFYFG